MKLLIVDDHPVLRAGLVALLRQAGPDTDVLQACDAGEALRLVEDHADLDAVVLDLMMPGMDGWQAISEFGRKRPALDRKSTRLNSSHPSISYDVFCLK